MSEEPLKQEQPNSEPQKAPPPKDTKAPAAAEPEQKAPPKPAAQPAKKTTSTAKGKKKKKKGQVYLKGISPADVEFSFRHMSMMLKSGLSLTESLAVIVEQLSDERLKETYEDILAEVQQGKNIADALAKYPKVFSEVVISIVRISEQTGTLESNLMYLADYLKKNYELQRKVKGALIYPLIVIGMVSAEMLGMIFFIMPRMETMFMAFENVPAFSLAVVGTARFIRENILYIGVAAVILGFIGFRYSKTTSGKRMVDKIAIKFPIINTLNIKNILSNFSRTLGMLLESGIPISRSVQITGETMVNFHYSEVILKVYKEVRDGKNLADSMIKYPDYFPISFVRIVEAGEKTGTLEENLSYLYDSYSGEVEEIANNMVTIIEPLLLLLAGGMIALLAISIVAPVYQFTSSIN